MSIRRLITQGVLTGTIVLHTFSLGILWFMSRQEPVYVNAEPVPVVQSLAKQAISGAPSQIIIPSLNINLAVEPGKYEAASDSWTLSGYNAHYATIMPLANDTAGNTFVYGHNNPYVFGPLKHLQPGASAEVVASNGNRFFYTYQKSYTVAPNDVSLFKYQGSPIMTVQTCTGTWHEKRQLYEFKFEKVIESSTEITQKDADRRQATLSAIASQMPVSSTKDVLL